MMNYTANEMEMIIDSIEIYYMSCRDAYINDHDDNLNRTANRDFDGEELDKIVKLANLAHKMHGEAETETRESMIAIMQAIVDRNNADSNAAKINVSNWIYDI